MKKLTLIILFFVSLAAYSQKDSITVAVGYPNAHPTEDLTTKYRIKILYIKCEGCPLTMTDGWLIETILSKKSGASRVRYFQDKKGNAIPSEFIYEYKQGKNIDF